jgi:hypothetical protein
MLATSAKAPANTLLCACAGTSIPIYVDGSGNLGPSALAVSLKLTPSTPGRESAVTVILRHTLTSDYADSTTDTALVLLFEHPAPALEGAALDVTLSGAAPRAYDRAAQRGMMQPAEGATAAVAAALGTVDVHGEWVLDVIDTGADAFAGRVSASLNFDVSPPSVPALTAGELCECADSQPAAFQTAIMPPSACQPLASACTGACDAAAPLQGFTYREATCLSSLDGRPAGLQDCYAFDCALAPDERAALQGASGRTVLLTASCAFYADCDAAHEYSVGPWSACTAACWATPADPASRPFTQREVVCYKTVAASGARMAVDLQDCQLAGSGAPPPALAPCNTQACPTSACEVRSVWSVPASASTSVHATCTDRPGQSRH